MSKRIKKDPFFESLNTDTQSHQKEDKKEENKVNQTIFSSKNRKQRKQQIIQKRYEELKIKTLFPLTELQDVSCTNPFLHIKYKSIRNCVLNNKKIEKEYFNVFYDKFLSNKRKLFYLMIENIKKKDVKKRRKYPAMKSLYVVGRGYILNRILRE